MMRAVSTALFGLVCVGLVRAQNTYTCEGCYSLPVADDCEPLGHWVWVPDPTWDDDGDCRLKTPSSSGCETEDPCEPKGTLVWNNTSAQDHLVMHEVGTKVVAAGQSEGIAINPGDYAVDCGGPDKTVTVLSSALPPLAPWELAWMHFQCSNCTHIPLF